MYEPKGNRITVDGTNRLFSEEFAWLESEVSKSSRCIVITHHAPTFKMIGLTEATGEMMSQVAAAR